MHCTSRPDRVSSSRSRPCVLMCTSMQSLRIWLHRIQGNPVELSRVTQDLHSLCTAYDFVTMEGAGGILCPIRIRSDPAPAAFRELVRSPCEDGLSAGCRCWSRYDTDAVGLTAAYLKEQGIVLRGIVFNRFEPGNLMHEDNKTMCELLTGVPVVACVRQGRYRPRPGREETLEALYKEADV